MRDKRLVTALGGEWHNLTTLDVNPDHSPDILHDLNKLPLPFDDNTFDEIHAYEVLEHLGSQGDFKAFFGLFNEIWRVLKPDGIFCAIVPSPNSPWAWGDPGHTRIIHPNSLVFLSREEYRKQVGVNSMSDYRYVYHGDFDVLNARIYNESFSFVLRAIKEEK